MALKRRAQAAIFDGIMFLLLVSFSCALIYVFVSTYGQNEDAILRSSYELNYLQSSLKALYYLDASTLDKVTSEGVSAYETTPSLKEPDSACKKLADYPGSISVVDLAKRDLSADESFDDFFGTNGVPVPGRTGMRCAAKELLKPLVYSGYQYFVEIGDVIGTSFNPKSPEPHGANVTNSLYGGCDDAQRNGEKVLAVSAPFRIPAGDLTKAYVIRLCVWPKSRQ